MFWFSSILGGVCLLMIPVLFELRGERYALWNLDVLLWVVLFSFFEIAMANMVMAGYFH